MLFIVIPSMVLANLIDMVTVAIINFTHFGAEIVSLNYANSFIFAFTNMAVYFTVALIGGLRQRHSDVGMTQDQKLAQPGPNYVAVGPYAPPPAPYAPHGTQLPTGQPAPTGQYSHPGQYAAPGQQAPQQQPSPVAYPPQRQYAAQGQPISQGQYAPPGQYAAPQQGHYAPPVQQYAVSGQPAPQQAQYGQQEMSNTPAPVARNVSPVQYAAPVAVSPAPYGAPSASVSPPPAHDQYQLHMPHQWGDVWRKLWSCRREGRLVAGVIPWVWRDGFVFYRLMTAWW
jgi:hypothetical protein